MSAWAESAVTTDDVLEGIDDKNLGLQAIIIATTSEPSYIGETVHCDMSTGYESWTATFESQGDGTAKATFNVPYVDVYKVYVEEGVYQNVNVTSLGQVKNCNVTRSMIFGVEWDGSATTSFSRTDNAETFTDPVPYRLNMVGNPSSPFDDIAPWSEMTVSERIGGTMVKIPKYYYKFTRTGSTMKLQIMAKEYAAKALELGFKVSPAHRDRGDGKGERDAVYIGRYHCGSDYKSKTGVAPKVNIKRSDARSGITAIAPTLYQNDYALRMTIWMLYLVEFADWNSQAKIGYGCGNNSAVQNMGYTDDMPYHTGTTLGSRTSYGLGTQYRNIEGLWDNCYDWCDGIYFSGANIYGIFNPANFSDTTGGTLLGTRPTDSNYISAFAFSEALGFDWFMYPSAITGSENTFVCDYCYYNASGVVLVVGGNYVQYQSHGLFYLDGYNAASYSYASIGSRLQELP